MDIFKAVAPLLIVGGIVIFVIKRLEQKHKQGTLGKKKSQGAQNILDSLIPIGMLFGCIIGGIVSMFLPISPLTTITLGAGIGYLIGYFAYEFYSNTEGNQS